MRKTLLIAAAALAGSIISSQAQVYSQNIVGYINQASVGGAYSMVSVPLSASPTNNAEQIFNELQTGDAVLLWDSAHAQYDTYTFLSAGQWLYPDQSTVGVGPNLAPGLGFFFQPSSSETNTFTGTVVLTNSVNVSGGIYYMVGSTPPIAASSFEDTNLNLPLQTGDAVLLWDSAHAQYDTYTFLSAGSWLYPDQSTVGASPGLSVAQGFFYQPSGNETWTQNLVVQ